MEISIADQLLDVLLSILIGVFLGLVNEIINSIRNILGVFEENQSLKKLENMNFPKIQNPLKRKVRKGSKGIILFFSDLLFFLITTLVLMIFIYHINDGIVRWYILLGAFLGFLLYKLLASKALNPIFSHITFWINIGLSYCLFFIFYPIGLFIKGARKKLARKVNNIKIMKQKNKKRKNVIFLGK